MAKSREKVNVNQRLTRRVLAAWLLTTDPYITDQTLNAELHKLDAPNDRFVRKDGSHYRKLFRAGRLPPCPEYDPREWDV